MSANDNFSLHDDEELSLHDDASLDGSVPASNKGDAPAKPPQIITTNTLSNIKLPVLQKDDYDTWAMEMEHYLEYIDNEVWKVIQNGNSKKRVTKGKDGVYRVLPPTTQEEQFADEKERKARTLLLMAVPKDHLRRFHGMDDAKEIWAAIKTRFGGNGNSKKMQRKPVRTEKEALMTIDEDNEVWKVIQYDELQYEFGDQEAALVAHKLAVKKLESQLKASHKQQSSLNEKLNFQANQIFEKDEKLKKYRRIGMKAVKDKDALQKIVDSWFASSKNLWKLIDCGMSSTVKLGLGHSIKSNAEVLGYEEEMSRGIFVLRETLLGLLKIRSSTEDTAEAKRSAVLKVQGRWQGGKQQRAVEDENTTMLLMALTVIMSQNVSSGSLHVSSGTHIKSGASNFNTGKQHVRSGRMYVNSGTQNKSGGSRVNTGKQNVNSGRDHPLEAICGIVGIFDSGCSGHMTGWLCLSYVGKGVSNRSLVMQGITQQKGVADEMNRTLIEAARTMLADSHLPPTFWAESVNTTCYSFNRLPCSSKEVIDIDVHTEEGADLMVVSSTSLSEKIATKKTHSPRQPSSTPISKSADDIMTFRKELDALALKHLGPVPTTVPTSTNPVNTGSITLLLLLRRLILAIHEASFLGLVLISTIYQNEVDVIQIPLLRIHICSSSKSNPWSIQIHLFRLEALQEISEAPCSRKSQKLLSGRWVEAMTEGTVCSSSYQQNKKGMSGESVVRNKAKAVDQCNMTRRRDDYVEVYKSKQKIGRHLPSTQMKYLAEILKKFDLVHVKVPSLHGDQVAFDKSVEGFDVDVQLVTPKTSHHNVTRGSSSTSRQTKLGIMYPRDSPLDLEAFSGILNVNTAVVDTAALNMICGAQRFPTKMDADRHTKIDLDALLARRWYEQEEEAAREAIALI
ncbi:ribonuclease H-like domain-containing protein [Tanacetum coccineum]